MRIYKCIYFIGCYEKIPRQQGGHSEQIEKNVYSMIPTNRLLLIVNVMKLKSK